MYQIALCDDEKEQLHITEKMLTEYQESHPEADFRVDSFESASTLISLIADETYFPDLILMDIYMPDQLGIEAAQYLVKPLAGEKLFPLLDRLLMEMQEDRKRYVLLRIENTLQRVAVDDIIYCEAQGKFQYLHFADGSQCMLRVTMARLVEMLAPYDEFMRVGVAFLINMEHIECVGKQEIRMDTGKKIYPPRNAYQAVREKYFAYYCGE